MIDKLPQPTDLAAATSAVHAIPAAVVKMLSSQLQAQQKQEQEKLHHHQLQQQLHHQQNHNQQETGGDNGDQSTEPSERTTPSKGRSLSDSDSGPPRLEPSPSFKESVRRKSKDDQALPPTPKTPRRPDFLRGLSLQMPPRDLDALGMGLRSPVSSSSSMQPQSRPVPLSPQLDRRDVYGSPVGNAKVLPRHSRGLDFSRACTNLHHSTLAEQSSPDSSPTITQKGMLIPARRSMAAGLGMSESPNMHHGAAGSWGLGVDRAGTSVGSVSMIVTDESSSDSDDLEPMDPDDDPMLLTPQVSKTHNPTATTPFGIAAASPSQWPSAFNPGGTSFLMSHRRSILRNKGRSRNSSSSASGHSSMASPGPRSPPVANNDNGGGYFAREVAMRNAGSRRESLSLGTLDLHISSGNDSGDEATLPGAATPARVVRRPVTRRGDMLPRGRAFSRIKAQLAEESAPVDAEMRKEAEVIRQVRDGDGEPVGYQATAQSSPTLPPNMSAPFDPLDPLDESAMSLDNAIYSTSGEPKGMMGAFGRHAHRNSGSDFWTNFELRTPPPPLFARAGSSAISDDMFMDSPLATTAAVAATTTSTTTATAASSIFGHSSNPSQNGSEDQRHVRAETPQTNMQPTVADALKKANKRLRDDDLDYSSIKRRAVSPGMSVTNSPVMSQSPAQRENNSNWNSKNGSSGSNNGNNNTSSNTAANGSNGGNGNGNGSGSGHGNGERSNSGGSLPSMTPSLGPKRVGLQAMGDTNDGMMKMSIE